jgi:hypothetical protein
MSLRDVETVLWGAGLLPDYRPTLGQMRWMARRILRGDGTQMSGDDA